MNSDACPRIQPAGEEISTSNSCHFQFAFSSSSDFQAHDTRRTLLQILPMLSPQCLQLESKHVSVSSLFSFPRFILKFQCFDDAPLKCIQVDFNLLPIRCLIVWH